MSSPKLAHSFATARTTQEKVAVLQKTDLFANLSEAVLMDIASRAITRHVKAGEVLCSEHDKASTMYVVVHGTLRSMRQNARGREQVLATEKAGAVLAAVPIFSGGKFYVTTIADTDCQVLCIDAQDVLNLCQQHPELLWSFLKLFANKVRHYAELIETLALRNVNQRVAQHLYTICQEQGLGHQETCTVEIKITQAEMASRIGSTREVVCRALGHLESEQLIQMEGTRAVKILSVPKLAKFAGVYHELEEPRIVSEISAEIA